MAVTLTINGTGYDYPETGDQRWGPDATDWAVAVTNGMLQKAGGLFQLLAEVDFGSSYGVKSIYYKSRNANPASSGQIRLGNTETIQWRNAGNDGDLPLTVSSGNRLQYNAVNIPTISSTDTITNKTINGPDNTITNLSNTNIASNAAIAFSKLATLTSGNILVGSGSNVATSVAMSGDVTIGNTGVTAIGANKVANGMLAQIATARFKGRTTASTGDVEDLTATQATALLNDVVGDSGSGGTKGLVPAPAAGDAAANKFLKADGTWVAPAGAGDVVGPASSTDNALTRFSGTTGKLVKNSVAILDNSGNLSGINNLNVSGTTTIATSLTGVVKAVSGVLSAAAIVNADVSASAAIAYSKLDLANNILNADINSAAGISYSKLAALTPSRALISSAGGVLIESSVTSTEVGYLSGVTSGIQGQFSNLLSSYEISNLGLTCTVGSSALTIALKDASGNDPSSGSPVKIGFRSSVSATGTFNQRSITGALSLVVSSGSTLGTTSGADYYLYVYAVDTGSGIVLGVSQALFDDGTLKSTTAEGGAGGADSNSVLYTTSAQTLKPIRLIARLLVNQVTAGTWASVPGQISFVPFFKKAVGFKARAGTTTIGNNSTTTIIYSTKEYDNQNMYDTSTGIATAPESGIYLVTARLQFASNAAAAAGRLYYIATSTNGTSQTNDDITGQIDYSYGTSAREYGSVASGLMYLASGDTVRIRGFQNSGGDVAMNSGSTECYFSMVKIGDF